MTTPEVTISIEQARGCGYRKPSKDGVGIYLVSDRIGAACGLLPYPLEVCPCCGGGIKPARGWTWVTPELLFKGDVLSALAGKEQECDRARRFRVLASADPSRVGQVLKGCPECPVGTAPAGKHGLLWVGEAFYPDPDAFMREAGRQGVSRKLKAVPKGFELGQTWVYLAHRFAVRDPATGKRLFPGVFSAFKPRQIDLVIADEHAVPEKALRLQEKLGDGARLVKVVRDTDAQMDLGQAEERTMH